MVLGVDIHFSFFQIDMKVLIIHAQPSRALYLRMKVRTFTTL